MISQQPRIPQRRRPRNRCDARWAAPAEGLEARAARLLATWTRYMDAGQFEAARRWMIALDDLDCDLFLEVHGRRVMEANEMRD